MTRGALRGILGSLMLAAALSSAPSSATEFLIHASPIGLYITQIGPTLDESGGLAIEIVAAAFRRANVAARISDAPWLRAQVEALDEEGGLLVMFGRIPAREARWTWLSMIYEDQIIGVTLRGHPVYTSFDEIRRSGATVGVKQAGASDLLLKTIGVKTDVTNDIATGLKKLLAGRLDVAVLQGMEIDQALGRILAAKGGADYDSRVPELVRTPLTMLPLWVVTSKKTSEEDVQRVRAALESFKQTEQYQAIIRKYEAMRQDHAWSH